MTKTNMDAQNKSIGLNDISFFPENLNELVTRSCLQALCKNAKRGIAVNLVIAVIVAIYLWNETGADSIFYWLGLNFLSTASGYYNTLTFPQQTAPKIKFERWLMRHFLGAIANGILWGYIGFMYFVPHTFMEEFIIVLMLGMAAGAVSTMSPHLPTFVGFSMPFLIPIPIMLMLHGETIDFVIAGLTTIFIIFVISTAKSMNDTLRDSFREKITSEFLNKSLQESFSALAVSKEAAEKANIAKSEFLSSMSHELRTPLNAIIGFADMIKEKVFGDIGNDKYETYINDIHGSGQHLLNLINDILDVSAIEAGEITLNEEYADIGEIIKSVKTMVMQRAAKGGVSVSIIISDNLPKVLIDVRRTKQIFLNLITNAIKFTPKGGNVSINCGKNDAGDLEIIVTDTGIGMDEEGIKIALSRFGQINNPHQHIREGTGLGLPITKELIEMHGATMLISSVPGQGTTLKVIMPQSRFADMA